jgi:hypothetical protein
MTTSDDPRGIAGIEDIAWDAVGFQPLTSKPADFVVALGDSYTSGEGAGSYEPWSDNNGSSASERNACHVSANSWIRKTVLPGTTQNIGTRADANAASLDFHTVACAGAQTENLLPFYTVPSGTAPANGEGQRGDSTQYSLVSQLDAGYLDQNTTLVTLSIGGNDMRFPPVIQACIIADFTVVGGGCADSVLPGDTLGAKDASAGRLSSAFPTSLGVVLAQIRSRAPNAKIVLMGYPKLFESGAACISIAEDNMGWLNGVSDGVRNAMSAAATAADTVSSPHVIFVDPQTTFTGHNLCTGSGVSGITGLEFTVQPGEDPILPGMGYVVNNAYASQTSVHPNGIGTQLYSDALEAALATTP